MFRMFGPRPPEVAQLQRFPETFEAAALPAAELAYEQVARKHQLDPLNIHQMMVCGLVSRHMFHTLQAQSIDCAVELRGADHRTDHAYLAKEHVGGDTIADPTWQQFLSAKLRSESIPKVLVGARNEVVNMAIAYGVEPGNPVVGLWLPFQPGGPEDYPAYRRY